MTPRDSNNTDAATETETDTETDTDSDRDRDIEAGDGDTFAAGRTPDTPEIARTTRERRELVATLQHTLPGSTTVIQTLGITGSLYADITELCDRRTLPAWFEQQCDLDAFLPRSFAIDAILCGELVTRSDHDASAETLHGADAGTSVLIFVPATYEHYPVVTAPPLLPDQPCKHQVATATTTFGDTQVAAARTAAELFAQVRMFEGQ